MPRTRWLGPALRWTGCDPPLPPPSLSLNFDGESTLRWFAPLLLLCQAGAQAGGPVLRPAAVLGWRQVPCWTGWQRPPFLPVLLAPPHPHPILIGPATSGGPAAAMRTLAAPPPCCSPASPSRRAHSLTVAARRADRLLRWPSAPTVCDLDRASDLRGQLPCCHADLLAAPPPC